MRAFRFVLVLSACLSWQQAFSQQIPFQFALTDTAGIELPNRSISVRTTFTTDTLSFQPEYQETQSVTTNQFGIASLWLGEGLSTLNSTYSLISTSWVNPESTFYLIVEVDSTNSGYQSLATLTYRFPMITVKAKNADSSSFALNAFMSDSALYSRFSDTTIYAVASDSAKYSDTSGYAISINSGAFADSSSVNEIQSIEQVLTVDSNADGRQLLNLGALTIGDSAGSSVITLNPIGSAAITINRTDAGLLLSRLTKSQRDVIVNPEQGLMVYCTDCETDGRVSVFDGNTWEILSQTNSAGSYAVISAGAIQNITVSGATFNSSVSDSAGTSVFAKGFCISSQPYPDLGDVVISPSLLDSAGIFKGRAEYLDRNSKYYLRAYATNAAGTVYGPQQEFLTEGLLSVGDTSGGGIVGYIFQIGDAGYSQSEQHGIIIMELDFPNQRPFGPSYCYNNVLYYTTYPLANTAILYDTTKTSVRIGDAAYNHELLMQRTNSCYLQNNIVHLIDTISWNGFDDWYLPTSEELKIIMETQRDEDLYDSGFAIRGSYFSSSTDGTWQNNFGSDSKGVKVWSLSSSAGTYPNFTTTYSIQSLNSSYTATRSIRLIRYF